MLDITIFCGICRASTNRPIDIASIYGALPRSVLEAQGYTVRATDTVVCRECYKEFMFREKVAESKLLEPLAEMRIDILNEMRNEQEGL